MAHSLRVNHLLRLKEHFRRERLLSEPHRQKLQEHRLRRLVDHAFNHTRFYRRLLRDADLSPNDIQSVNDLAKLPHISKADIIDHLADLHADNYSVACVFKTSSSNVPFEFDAQAVAIAKVKTLMSYADSFSRAGLIRGIRVLHMVSFNEINKETMNPGPVIERVKLLAYPTYPEDCFDDVDNFQPHVIFAYPSFISAYARHMSQNRAKPALRLVVACGELSDETALAEWRTALNTEVICQYAATESLCPIATTCPLGQLHVDTSLFILESLPVEGIHHLVLTSLFNYRMPLIRYDLEDLGIVSKETCACGKRSLIITVMQGRLCETLHLPDGRLVPPIELLRVMRRIPEVVEWQALEESPGVIRLCLICDERRGTPRHVIANHVRKELAQTISQELKITIAWTLKIRCEPGGKKRLVISRVKERKRPRLNLQQFPPSLVGFADGT